MEDNLRAIWAKVLDTDASDIDSEANFFELGGDSVGAINVVGHATEEGIAIDAQSIFTNPTLSALARLANMRKEQTNVEEDGQSSTSQSETLNQLLPHWDLVNSCLLQCGLGRSQVQDIIPCTPFQCELMAAGHSLNCWQFQAVWELEGDIQHAKRVFEIIYQRNDVFRTRIVKYGSSSYQVVSSEGIVWHEVQGSLEEYKRQQLEKRMAYGDALSRFAIVHDGSHPYLVWSLTHAIYDRLGKILWFDDIAECFRDPDRYERKPNRPRFADFSRFVGFQDQQKGIDHWKQHLHGLERFDTLFSDEEASKREFQTTPYAETRIKMKYTKPPQTRINFSTIVHVAYALVLANESGFDDVFFPTIRSCRSMAMPGVESIMGPVWSMVPCRVQLEPLQSLQDLLQQVEQATIGGMPHESFGITAMNQFFGHKRFLQTALLPQPPKPNNFNEKVTAKAIDTLEPVTLQPREELFSQTRSHFGLYIMVTPVGEDLDLWARFDKSFVNEERTKRLLTELSSMIDRISKGSADWKTTTLGTLCHKLPKPHGETINGANGVNETNGVRGINGVNGVNGASSSDAASNVELCEGNTLQQLLPNDANNTAVVVPGDKGYEVSYQDLSQHVKQLQEELAAIGIKKASAVSMALPNCYELIVAFLATAWQRGIAAPLNTAYKQDEVEFYVDDLGSSLILVEKGAYEKSAPPVIAAKKHNAAVAEVSFTGSKVSFDVKEKGSLTPAPSNNLLTPLKDDTALVLHTSGTTSKPKAVPLTHKNLISNIDNIVSTYALTPIDRTMLIMPLFHVHGLLASFLSPLRSGGGVILPSRLLPSFWNDFTQHKATWYSATPTMHRLILGFPTPERVPEIRFIRSCSSQLSPELFHQLEDKFSAPVLESYAMTEACHLMTSNPLPPAKHYPGCVGVASDRITLRILDQEGNAVPQGEEGEVSVIGENVTKGYINRPEANAESFTKDGFFRTGDQGKLSPEGYLTLTGRLEELINKGGEKISPVELDNTISQHEAVQEAVCFAVEDEMYGQDVACAVKLKEGQKLDAKALKAWCRERLSGLKVPSKVFFPEDIPKTATGKLQRRSVAEAMGKMQPA